MLVEEATDKVVEEVTQTLTATYSPDDNKLRLYAKERLAEPLDHQVRDAGFIWAPKQRLFVAPMWTPGRQDLLLELCGYIASAGVTYRDDRKYRALRDLISQRGGSIETLPAGSFAMSGTGVHTVMVTIG
jgi:hypothetical protein